jgi:hypothetical protein
MTRSLIAVAACSCATVRRLAAHLPDPALDRADHVEQQALRVGPVAERLDHDVTGGVLVAGRDGVPEPFGVLGHPGRAGGGAHAVYLPRP